MAGKSVRFRDAGFELPKALLKANEKTIIHRIILNFPIATKILIIAAKDQMYALQAEMAENNFPKPVEIAYIDSHDKGPSFSIWSAKEKIDSGLPTIVSYCDVAVALDTEKFLVELVDAEASFVVIKGFHPHTLRKPKFGYVLCDKNNKVLEVREKQSFSKKPIEEFASAGIYGFRTGKILLNSIRAQIDLDLHLSGEFYLSLSIQTIVNSKNRVTAFLVDRFVSWGTPEDLADFNYYSKVEKEISSPADNVVSGTSRIFLAGGLGLRLKDIATTFKQFLPLRDESEQLWTRSSGLVITDTGTVLAFGAKLLDKLVIPKGWKATIIEVEESTNSACITAKIALENSNLDLSKPVTLIATDNLIGFESSTNLDFINFDVMVWVAKYYPIADLNSGDYSWVTFSDSERIDDISIKNRPMDGRQWHIITGNITFHDSQIANKLLSETITTSIQDGPELHLDNVIGVALEKGLLVKALVVPIFLSIGSPNEYDLYNYLLEGTYGSL